MAFRLPSASCQPGGYIDGVKIMTAEFVYKFTVSAPLHRVAEFHRQTQTLKQLTPPPIFVQFHHLEPLAEGSRAEFTLWFGPFPVRWEAVHTNVDSLRGFTDTQVRGPLRRWRHQHRFSVGAGEVTCIEERIEIEHHPGLRGWLSRVLYSKPALRFLFLYRQFVTRRALEKKG